MLCNQENPKEGALPCVGPAREELPARSHRLCSYNYSVQLSWTESTNHYGSVTWRGVVARKRRASTPNCHQASRRLLLPLLTGAAETFDPAGA
ncbi:hypothetical protein J6590_001573 [Homalodisca vitripennis]|nr:hypothetical protein J6590_001573 [Homalodisca vitripennis]